MTKMMPEFKSEMQCSSYLPVCSTTKDLLASGSSRQLLNNNQVQTFGHSRTWHHNDQVQIAGYGYNNLYPSSNASQLQDHLKEIMRKTMLEHEATFKHQVSELHRVYGRQRELMDERRMKRLTRNNIEGKISKTNPIMFGGLSESNQTCQVGKFSLVNPSCHWPSRTINIEANYPSEGISSRSNFIPTITDLADWNKTFLLNQKGPLYSSGFFPSSTSIMAEPHLEQSYAQMPNMVNRMQIEKDLEIHSEDLYLKKLSGQREHTSSNHLMSSTKPFDTQESSSKSATLSIGNNCLNNSICLSGKLTYNPRYQIDLNSYPNEDGSSQVEVETRNAADINLEPPVSPQNKEASPPRSNSVEKQPSESVELTEKDDKFQKDLALLAAEALVLISSNSDQCLKWFAEIVTSAENHLEENETAQGHVAVGKTRELVGDGLNNFAALTPLMEETKLGQYCFNSTRNRKQIAPTTSSSLRSRKKTRQTTSQKAMHGDILPHMTSLSRQEVSEETRTISWLRENESKARLGKRKSSKNERQKGKKRNREPTLLQQAADAKLDSLKRCLPDWGRRNKRQTGHRRPPSDHALRLAVLRFEGPLLESSFI
ncbi:hypothetical protein ACET3Z_027211 [Daucus carota]